MEESGPSTLPPGSQGSGNEEGRAGPLQLVGPAPTAPAPPPPPTAPPSLVRRKTRSSYPGGSRRHSWSTSEESNAFTCVISLIPSVMRGRVGFIIWGRKLQAPKILLQHILCCDRHVRYLLRCHIAVAGHALLGVADASGSIELLHLVRSEVSDWGQA